MRAVRFGLSLLAGAIAFSALADLAVVLPVVEVFLYVLILLWSLSLTDHGHNALVDTFHLSHAQVGSLRLLVFVCFVAGLAVNLSFEGLPQWLLVDPFKSSR